MDVLDSRRLTGPGLLLDRPGAVLDVRLGGQDPDRAIAAWESAARRLLRDVGWADEQLATRRFPGGVSLALTAPVDGLYAATELNERAWEAAAAELGDGPHPDYAAGVECHPRTRSRRRAIRRWWRSGPRPGLAG